MLSEEDYNSDCAAEYAELWDRCAAFQGFVAQIAETPPRCSGCAGAQTLLELIERARSLIAEHGQ